MNDADLPLLLIVTGLPCSGKTTVARRIAVDLNLPLVTKDDIKERLFETLGWSDRTWSRKLGKATYKLLYYIIESFLAGRNSLIVESNFPPVMASEWLEDLRERFNIRVGQVECVAQAEVLKERWRRRAELGTRHPGHNDSASLDEFLGLIDTYTDSDGYGRLGLPDQDAPKWTVDTTHQADLARLIDELKFKLALG